MSAILRKRQLSSGGMPSQPSSCGIPGHHRHPYDFADVPIAKKRRFVDVVKILLDIAKESSDAFPPLKSCLGGINALIKHYEVRWYKTTAW
jgi:hypothetical protein